MKIDIGSDLEQFVSEAVKAGRYPSAEAMVVTALELLASHESTLQELRTLLQDAIDEGGENSDEDVAAAIEETSRRLAQEAG
jgi:putative addiction module CopG family antidote